ncbi:hypothetical protein QQF64_023369 [Cirrhinus molitorella]|uniref:Uncharacterized protein n=1 Tax=Cirrhinus molitorella TaxID=172907 RepID=A0ABR3L590_9TELE
MEELIIKYIAKHGSVGMFDGIEKIVENPYEWAISKFENFPKMPRNGKIANALQAVLASYKVTKRRVDELEAENKRLSFRVVATKNDNASETIWKEEKVRMQNKITRLTTNNSMLRSSVEALSNNLEEEKVACQFMIKNGTTKKHSSKTPLGVTMCNPISEVLDLQEDESWERDSEYSDCTARFPIAPVRTRQNGNGNERVLDQRTENGQAVRQLSFMDFQSLVTAVGTFDPDNMDPVEFSSKLEKVVNVYSVSDEDACRLLMICIPRSLTGALSQEIRDKRADREARREALLRLVGTDLVNLRKITEYKRFPAEQVEPEDFEMKKDIVKNRVITMSEKIKRLPDLQDPELQS